jgi:hypothetical protein
MWIEDRPEEILPGPEGTADLEPWFSLISIEGPQSLKQLVTESLAQPCETGGGTAVYALEGAPCDVYLTDFRLCDRRNEDCTLPAHIEAGLHAPSGGFLLGLLTALRWPDHPQCLIPYSGYSEEFGQIWRLVRSFCPESVHVLWDERVGKGNRNQDELVKLIAPQYRTALEKALGTALIHMPLVERDRWEFLLAQCGDRVAGSELLWFVGEYGLRPLLAGALFYDALEPGPPLERCIPASAVREWLAGKVPPGADPLERDARRLAECYWHLRISPLSRYVYRIIEQRKLGVVHENLPESPPGFPSLLQWKQGKEGTDLGMRTRRLVRLAFLLLIVREHHARRGPRSCSTSSEELKILRERLSQLVTVHLLTAAIPDINSFVQDLKQTIHSLNIDDEKLAQALDELGTRQTVTGRSLFEEVTDSYSEAVDHLDLPISDLTVIRLVDPLPSKWEQPLTLDRSQALGAAVSRLWSEASAKDFDVRDMLQGDASRLTPTEKLCARRYARELMPSERDWPRLLT